MYHFATLVLVFGFAGVIAYQLIRRVPPRLHTPLMSMTNAISAVIILGAVLIFSSPTLLWEDITGTVAVIAASFNIVGGVLVTHRMLRFFK